jgi:hypothetical protein
MQTMQQKRKNSLAQLQAALAARRGVGARMQHTAPENQTKIKNLERMVAQTEAAIQRGGN